MHAYDTIAAFDGENILSVQEKYMGSSTEQVYTHVWFSNIKFYVSFTSIPNTSCPLFFSL